MLKEDAVKLMSSSKTEEEWNANCDKVKAAHNGDYPDYWFDAIMSSGVAWRVSMNFAQ